MSGEKVTLIGNHPMAGSSANAVYEVKKRFADDGWEEVTLIRVEQLEVGWKVTLEASATSDVK